MTTEELLRHYRIQTKQIDGVLFSPDSVKKLVISFTGMNPGKLERWSWFYEWFKNADSTMYIVLRDEDHLFYLNRDDNDIRDAHVNFLSDIIVTHNIDTNYITTIGSSMGGYAALYYGCLLNARMSIVSVPLVDMESAALNKYTLWTRKMKELQDNWENLDNFLSKKNYLPEMFLINGKFNADVSASKKLTDLFSNRGVSFNHVQTDDDEHGDYLSKNTLYKLLHKTHDDDNIDDE